jgi:hypothetical protein
MTATSPREGRWAKVAHDDDAVFRRSGGATTLRVFVLLCRKALTDYRITTEERPLGHVVASEVAIAVELRLTAKTVRGHVRRLIDAGLVVLWRPPVRGQVVLRDGVWRGLSKELVVAHLATEETLAEAKRREVRREEKRAQRTAAITARAAGRPRRRSDDGRFSRAEHNDLVTQLLPHADSPTGTGAPAATGAGLPVATGAQLPVDAWSDQRKDARTDLGMGDPGEETLIKVQGPPPRATAGSQRPSTTPRGTTDRPTPGNRSAWIVLIKAVHDGLLPPLSDGQLAGCAHALTIWSGGDLKRMKIALAEACDFLEPDAEIEDVRDALSDAMGISQIEWWDAVDAGATQWATESRAR